jgi:hypothetical protein
MRQNPKTFEIRGQKTKKNGFFGPVPKSHTQMGSLSAKNASEKFSRLGTFKKATNVVIMVLTFAFAYL